MKSADISTINSRFKQLSLGIYPFISRNRVTVLKKGFYEKNKANYKGVSYIYNNVTNLGRVVLMGYVYIPHDCVIVPIGLELSEGKASLVNDMIGKGYIKYSGFPSFRSYEFDEDTSEYKTAKLINEKYKSLTKNDKVNNREECALIG